MVYTLAKLELSHKATIKQALNTSEQYAKSIKESKQFEEMKKGSFLFIFNFFRT